MMQEYCIPFFADKGVTEINTSLKNLILMLQLKVLNNKKLRRIFKMMSKFNDKNLDLLKQVLASKVIANDKSDHLNKTNKSLESKICIHY